MSPASWPPAAITGHSVFGVSTDILRTIDDIHPVLRKSLQDISAEHPQKRSGASASQQYSTAHPTRARSSVPVIRRGLLAAAISAMVSGREADVHRRARGNLTRIRHADRRRSSTGGKALMRRRCRLDGRQSLTRCTQRSAARTAARLIANASPSPIAAWFVVDAGNPADRCRRPRGPRDPSCGCPGTRPSTPLPSSSARDDRKEVSFVSRAGDRRRIRVLRAGGATTRWSGCTAFAKATRQAQAGRHVCAWCVRPRRRSRAGQAGTSGAADSLIEARQMALRRSSRSSDAADRHDDYEPGSPFRTVLLDGDRAVDRAPLRGDEPASRDHAAFRSARSARSTPASTAASASTRASWWRRRLRRGNSRRCRHRRGSATRFAIATGTYDIRWSPTRERCATNCSGGGWRCGHARAAAGT